MIYTYTSSLISLCFKDSQVVSFECYEFFLALSFAFFFFPFPIYFTFKKQTTSELK